MGLLALAAHVPFGSDGLVRTPRWFLTEAQLYAKHMEDALERPGWNWTKELKSYYIYRSLPLSHSFDEQIQPFAASKCMN